MHCSPETYLPSHFIAEFYRLPLGEVTLTTPDSFLLYHLPRNAFQE